MAPAAERPNEPMGSITKPIFPSSDTSIFVGACRSGEERVLDGGRDWAASRPFLSAAPDGTEEAGREGRELGYRGEDAGCELEEEGTLV